MGCPRNRRLLGGTPAVDYQFAAGHEGRFIGSQEQHSESHVLGAGHIFPTHTQDGGYDMPRPEVAAFRDVIFPGLRG